MQNTFQDLNSLQVMEISCFLCLHGWVCAAWSTIPQTLLFHHYSLCNFAVKSIISQNGFSKYWFPSAIKLLWRIKLAAVITAKHPEEVPDVEKCKGVAAKTKIILSKPIKVNS